MIYITGDTHGEIARMDLPFIPEEITAGDYLIICGDFGFIFSANEEEERVLDSFAQKPFTILFTDGNHENFNALNGYPVEEWNGGKVHRIRKNILHLMRGQVFSIEGKTFFTMGGAYSIDRYMRRKDISYWEEELPDREDYAEATASIMAYNKKVDYIITHTAPRMIIGMMGYCPDPHDMELTGFLEWIMYECSFKHWYFGHFHEDRRITDRFTALYYDVIKICD